MEMKQGSLLFVNKKKQKNFVNKDPEITNLASGMEVQGVAKYYGDGPLRRTVIEDCSFTLERGKVTVMIGPSGGGKSTLVRLLAGFEKPSAGHILIDDREVQRAGPDRLVVFQETALYPWMSTEENVLFGPKAQGVAAGTARARVDELLRRVGLAGFRDKYPAQLSGGMKRRAELARALANDPAVMILDEPFRGLDAMTRSLMVEYYAELIEETRTTHLFVTTDVDEAIVLADRILVMSHRPMRLISDIPVDLPRPRHLLDVIANNKASDIKRRVIELIHLEVMRSFGGRTSGMKSTG